VKEVPEGTSAAARRASTTSSSLEIAGQLRERKVGNILKTRPDLVATGNIGCMTQIGKGFIDGGHAIPVIHTAELIDWATGGPMPSVLEEAGFADVPVTGPVARKNVLLAAE
jgi:glycolate oxidase iron-sulfur subunit